MTKHHEFTDDGATWFWFPDLAEEGEPFAGHWVPQLQCDGYIPSVDGIAFNSAADCQAWINEAAKAAPLPPQESYPSMPRSASDAVAIPPADLSVLLAAAAVVAGDESAPELLKPLVAEVAKRYKVRIEVTQ